MDKTLVLFEFKDEIESFILQNSIDRLMGENVYILALHLEARAYLKKKGILHFDTAQFFNRESHQNLLLKSNEIINWIRQSFTIRDDFGAKEGYSNTFIFCLRSFLHHILWLTEVLENACSKLNVKKIISCQRDNSVITEPFLFTKEGYVSEIGAKIAKKLNIGFESFPGGKVNQNMFLKKLTNLVKEIATFSIYQLKYRFLIFWVRNKKIILTTSRSYNLGRVLDELKHTFSNVYVVYLNNKQGTYFQKLLATVVSCEVVLLPTILTKKKWKSFNGKLNDFVKMLEVSHDRGEFFTYKGVSFKGLILNKIIKDIIPAVRETYIQSVYLKSFIKKYRPALIISQMARGLNYNLGELATLYKIPSLLISHGSHVPPENDYERIEWKEHGFGLINTHYQYVALQSPWAKAYIDSIPIASKQIITGPLLYADMVRNKNKEIRLKENAFLAHKDKIILLHADTPRLRGSFRFYVYQTVDEYIESLNALIRAVEKAKDFYLMIRVRPNYYLTKEDLKEVLIESDCYSIHTEGNFVDYLSMAEMLISYSSTTIEEALQNRVPVLLFDRDGKYCHIKSAQLLEPSVKPEINSCYYVRNEDVLKWALQWLNEHHFSKEVPDSLWDMHVFSDIEKQRLTDYFGSCFTN